MSTIARGYSRRAKVDRICYDNRSCHTNATSVESSRIAPDSTRQTACSWRGNVETVCVRPEESRSTTALLHRTDVRRSEPPCRTQHGELSSHREVRSVVG